MKTCEGCKYAEWKRTSNGRLHPDKLGRCAYKWVMPPLPQSMYFINGAHPFGGWIERGRVLKDHCVYWAKADK
jgi:hypothetical protein